MTIMIYEKKWSDKKQEAIFCLFAKELQTASNKKTEYDFIDIDLDWYTDFTAYLSNVKMYKINSIGKYIKILKIVLNDATE
jgi:hypothetical protein